MNLSTDAMVAHWHDQTAPNVQGGVVETGGTLIPAGGRQGYDFAPGPGTHWMHSHHELEEQPLLAAPLAIRPAGVTHRIALTAAIMPYAWGSVPDPGAITRHYASAWGSGLCWRCTTPIRGGTRCI